MMDFINPHAILLSKENLCDIHHTVGAQYEALTELLEESADMAMPVYIIGKRNSITGLPEWECMTQVEFCIEYRLGKIDPRVNTNFTKM